MDIAIVTGASSGLGAAFAKKIIETEKGLDEIWLIARRKERLEQMKEKYNDDRIKSVVLDLSEEDSFLILNDKLKAEKITIKILINNAGFERVGSFEQMTQKDIVQMINVNIAGMTLLNHVCLPYMEKGSYEVITASVSSFAPVPNQAVYSASKAYTLFLGEALHQEVKKKGIHIHVFSPGNMDTEMNHKAEVENVHGRKIALLPFLNVDKEVYKVMKKAKQGRPSYIPNIVYKGYYMLTRFLPISTSAKMAEL